MPFLEISATAAAVAIASTFLLGREKILDGACERLEPYLQSQMVGQDMAIQQFSDAICDHISQQHPQKPLVISAHGSPGVGKSYLHKLAAKALFNRDPNLDLKCPGMDCPSLKVFSGLDYVSADRSQQHERLKSAVLDHLKKMPQALIVIDEYDKMDCQTQHVFRQLIQGSHNAGIDMSRSIVLLESNAGFNELHQLLVKKRDRSKMSAEEVQRMLKETVAEKWDAAGCHDHASLWTMMGTVDFFLPFLPLERSHLERLFNIHLSSVAARLLQSHQAHLTWSPDVVSFLSSKVDYDGPYAIEGAKEAGVLMTRYLSRLLRQWQGRHPRSFQVWPVIKQVAARIPDSMSTALQSQQQASHALRLLVKPQRDGLELREKQPRP